MKTTKRRFEQFLFYDYTGIKAHLEKMAMKGWQIHKIKRFYWEYCKKEPQKLTYAVSYFSEASEFNPYPTDNQQTFHEYCKGAGWQLVAEQAQMQIFCSEQANPTPIETEESVKLKAIHRSMKKNFLPSSMLMLLLSLFQIVLQFSTIMRSPVSSLVNVTTLPLIVIWNIITINMLTNLIGYAVWYYRSKKAISTGGTCIESSSGYKKVYYFMWILLGIALALTVFMMSSQQFGWVGGLGIIDVSVTIVLVLAIKNTLKGTGVSRRINLTVTIISCAILSFALTGAMAWGIVRGVNAGWFDNKPNETYTITQPDGSTYTWDIYHNPLPLKVEDLQSVDYNHYSYEWTASETVLLGHFVGWQKPFPDGQHAPELRYEIVEVKLAVLFDICLNDYLDKYDYDWDEPEDFKSYFQITDDPAWQADAVYQLYYQGEGMNEYILCWGNRIVNISFEEIPTTEQITIVVEKLGK
ncbi:MAG: DUF2812 domain-containing protein [Clostridiales bacterium]|nr:DUF2812 domain-containing protein [Clostridiales bacterium]